jgi:MscS family membrane protein
MAFSDTLSSVYYGNSLGEWSYALLIIFGAFVLGKVFYWILGNVVKKLTSRTKTKLDDIIIDMIEEPIMLAIILYGIWYGISTLILPEFLMNWIGKVFHVLVVINIAWLITRLFDSVFQEYIAPIAGKTKSDLDDQILPLIRKSVKIFIWVLAIIIALNNAGYDVGAVLAGLGIGGLALAMAAKDTVSNIFGGFTILADKPFKMKDRIKVNGIDGTVEEIGLRSTKIRTLAGTRVSIPNSVFSENPIENVTVEPSRKIKLDLGLTYDTTPEQMDNAMRILKDVAKKEKGINENYKIAFNSFGDFSLGIMFIYYIKKSSDILKTQNDINLKILREFNKNGLNMAFPTQTIELKK